jgi:S-adenosylmethionine-diacylglycerol 3-amino-3-carboxypropyl transferase
LRKYLNSCPEKINKFNLSDIFEKTTQNEYEELLSIISNRSTATAKICYWNNMVKRKPTRKDRKLKHLKDMSEKLFKTDRTFFYSDFIIEEKTKT